MVVFVDEIHRFNKAQQDAFLPYVESGVIVLIGATTENPSFEVIGPLLSRCKVYVLNPLQPAEIEEILRRALTDKERGLGNVAITVPDEVLNQLAVYANGDARIALNIFELAVSLATAQEIGFHADSDDRRPGIRAAEEDPAIRQGRRGTLQPDLRTPQIPAKQRSGCVSILAGPDAGSRRGSGLYRAPHGAVCLRRCRTCRCSRTQRRPECHRCGAAHRPARNASWPLPRQPYIFPLAPKSNALYTAYSAVVSDVQHTFNEPPPLHIRNAPTNLMKDLGYGKGYQYAHDLKEKVADMECLPESLRDRQYYHPTDQGMERRIQEILAEITAKKKAVPQKNPELSVCAFQVINQDKPRQQKSIDHKWHKAFCLKIVQKESNAKKSGHRSEQKTHAHHAPVHGRACNCGC